MIQSKESWAIITIRWVEQRKIGSREWHQVDFHLKILSGKNLNLEGSLVFKYMWKNWMEIKLPARWVGKTLRRGRSLASSQIWWLPWKGSPLALEVERVSV
eukprot:c19241_g1_i1 orf=151-453(+)